MFRDLKPYVCTFKECNLRMFQSRNEWLAHELQAHRREWTCPHCQAAPFSSKGSFQSHLKTAHNLVLAGSELEAVTLQSEGPVERIPSTACSLCEDWQSSILNSNKNFARAFLNDGKDIQPYGTLKQFRRHLGRHMEQLALFALPMNGEEEVEDESSDEDDGVSDIIFGDSKDERSGLNQQEEEQDEQVNPQRNNGNADREERLAKETGPTEDRPRDTVMIRGRPIDITDLGFDIEFLMNLPEDLREEVIMSTVAEQRSQAAAAGTQPSDFDQKLLDSLPEDMRQEIIQQERRDKRRRDDEFLASLGTAKGGLTFAAENDAASIPATLPPDLRSQILISQDETTPSDPTLHRRDELPQSNETRPSRPVMALDDERSAEFEGYAGSALDRKTVRMESESKAPVSDADDEIPAFSKEDSKAAQPAVEEAPKDFNSTLSSVPTSEEVQNKIAESESYMPRATAAMWEEEGSKCFQVEAKVISPVESPLRECRERNFADDEFKETNSGSTRAWLWKGTGCSRECKRADCG